MYLLNCKVNGPVHIFCNFAPHDNQFYTTQFYHVKHCSTFVMWSNLSLLHISILFHVKFYNVCCLFAFYTILTQYLFFSLDLITFVWSKNELNILLCARTNFLQFVFFWPWHIIVTCALPSTNNNYFRNSIPQMWGQSGSNEVIENLPRSISVIFW